jgi:hypothetical protein
MNQIRDLTEIQVLDGPSTLQLDTMHSNGINSIFSSVECKAVPMVN